MDHKNYNGIYVGLILLVTAAALVAKKMELFVYDGTTSHWWVLFLLIPIGAFTIRAVERWHQGDRRKCRHMIRIALLILPVMAASLYSPLWKVIYIPFIAVIGIDMIVWNIIGSREPKE